MIAFKIGLIIVIVVTLLMIVFIKNRNNEGDVLKEESPKSNIEIRENIVHKDSYNAIAWLIVFLLIPMCIGFGMALDEVSELAKLTPVFSILIIYLVCLAYKLGSIKKRYYMAILYSFAYMFNIMVLVFVIITFPLRFLQESYDINLLNSVCIIIGNIMIILTLYFVSVKDIDVFSSIFKFKKVYFERTYELKEFIRVKKEKKKSDSIS
jgi:hypothetical protein